jgi:hypothetical protein
MLRSLRIRCSFSRGSKWCSTGLLEGSIFSMVSVCVNSFTALIRGSGGPKKSEDDRLFDGLLIDI